MTKQKIEVEVDFPDEYEATGEFRMPSDGEYYITREGCVMDRNAQVNGPQIILRKKYEPPKWLKPGTWIYENDGKWFASNREPSRCCAGYISNHPSVTTKLSNDLFPSFTPPPVNLYRIPGSLTATK